MMKFLILIFPLFFLLACKVKEPIPNRPPREVTVKSTLGTDGKTVTLNWTKAKDPDGDAVTYTVVLGSDTLAKGLTDTVYVLKNLDFEFKGTGSIIVLDTKKLSSNSSFSLETKENPFFSIPDANFESYLVNFKIDKDGIVNGKMAKAETEGVKSLYCSQKDINSLSGIEYFVDLETLYCTGNNLIGLDVNKNLKLKDLFCSSNQLKILDVSKNLNLKVLWCNSNLLQTLDISKNLNLESLNCSKNQLSRLDVNSNVKLNGLDCSINQILNLDVSKIVILYELNCTNNKINTICVKDFIWTNTSGWRKDSNAEYKICN